MAIGQCQYMACRSALGTTFRAGFTVGVESSEVVYTEVLLCPDHERECSELRRLWPGRLLMTEEGHVYSGLWMDSLGFLTR